MIRYFCDLCGNECNNKIFSVPIAATFMESEPSDLLPIEMVLCYKCRSDIYKTIEKIIPCDKLKKLNTFALDLKIGRE